MGIPSTAYGAGDAGKRIADILIGWLATNAEEREVIKTDIAVAQSA
jgi:hypothetical protein